MRLLAGICALTVFGAMVFYTVPVEMSYLLDDLGVESTGLIGLATAVASAATVVGSIAFTRLSGSPDRRLPLVFALCASGFVVIALANSPVIVIVGAVLNCLGTGMLLPSLLTIAMSRLSYADRGRGTGLWTAAFFAGEFICPLVLIGLESATGSMAHAVGILGLASALVAGGCCSGVAASRNPAGRNSSHSLLSRASRAASWTLGPSGPVAAQRPQKSTGAVSAMPAPGAAPFPSGRGRLQWLLGSWAEGVAEPPW